MAEAQVELPEQQGEEQEHAEAPEQGSDGGSEVPTAPGRVLCCMSDGDAPFSGRGCSSEWRRLLLCATSAWRWRRHSVRPSCAPGVERRSTAPGTTARIVPRNRAEHARARTARRLSLRPVEGPQKRQARAGRSASWIGAAQARRWWGAHKTEVQTARQPMQSTDSPDTTAARMSSGSIASTASVAGSLERVKSEVLPRSSPALLSPILPSPTQMQGLA